MRRAVAIWQAEQVGDAVADRDDGGGRAGHQGDRPWHADRGREVPGARVQQPTRW